MSSNAEPSSLYITSPPKGQHPNPALIFFLPFIIMIIGFTLLIILVHKSEKEPSLKNKLRVLFYYMLQFLCLPLLVLFLFINGILILISYLFLRSLWYISIKNMVEFFEKICGKICCCKSKVASIKIERKSDDVKLPERANRYKDVSDNSKQDNTSNNTGGAMNLNLNNKNVFNNINMNNYRPQVQKTKTKNKFMSFLQNVLINEDNNTPGFINLMRSIKNKAKEKMDENEKGVVIKNNINSL